MGLSVVGVNITAELAKRSCRTPDVEGELDAMRRIAKTMGAHPSVTFDACVNAALQLCHADTCGISIRQKNAQGEDVFLWVALAGRLKDYLHGTMPRFDSPCGVTVDSAAPVLMRRPDLAYPPLDVGVPFHDVLLIPLTPNETHLEGTIWIVSHNEERKFDAEDSRIMQRIGFFTSSAARMYVGARTHLGSRVQFEGGDVHRAIPRKTFSAGETLISPGDRLDRPVLLTRGWAGSVVFLPDGRRQIIELFIPGDVVGYCSRSGVLAQTSFTALTDVECAPVNLVLARSGETEAAVKLRQHLLDSEMASDARLRGQVVRNGRLSALEAISSFVLDLHSRFYAMDKLVDDTFEFPITQEVIADSVCLTVVHVNRTLQKLRRSGIISLTNHRMKVCDLARLRALALPIHDAEEYRAGSGR